MATDEERDRFRNALLKLLSKSAFQNFNVFLMVREHDTGETLMTGTMCMVCALDELQEFIDDNGIKHFYTDDETKH